MSDKKAEGLTPEDVADIQGQLEKDSEHVKILFDELHRRIDEYESTRERSLAKTKLDECELWLTRCFRIVKVPCDD